MRLLAVMKREEMNGYRSVLLPLVLSLFLKQCSICSTSAEAQYAKVFVESADRNAVEAEGHIVDQQEEEGDVILIEQLREGDLGAHHQAGDHDHDPVVQLS